jgi:hypothetical protein
LIGPRFVLFDLERGNDSTQAIGQGSRKEQGFEFGRFRFGSITPICA